MNWKKILKQTQKLWTRIVGFLFIGGYIFYLPYLCLFDYSGVQHILCCVFFYFPSCCQFLWIVLFWLPLRVFSNVYFHLSSLLFVDCNLGHFKKLSFRCKYSDIIQARSKTWHPTSESKVSTHTVFQHVDIYRIRGTLSIEIARKALLWIIAYATSVEYHAPCTPIRTFIQSMRIVATTKDYDFRSQSNSPFFFSVCKNICLSVIPWSFLCISWKCTKYFSWTLSRKQPIH